MKRVEDTARNFDFHGDALDTVFDDYAQLRAECPVGRSEKYGGFWFVTKSDDIFKAEQSPTLWQSFDIWNPHAQSQLTPTCKIGVFKQLQNSAHAFVGSRETFDVYSFKHDHKLIPIHVVFSWAAIK